MLWHWRPHTELFLIQVKLSWCHATRCSNPTDLQVRLTRFLRSYDRADNAVNQQATSIDLDTDKSEACITFSKAIAKGPFRLVVRFKGRIENSMCGFYRAKYEPLSDCNVASVQTGHGSYLVTTHFEPCSARKAFPCFDEPHLKATFELELEIPTHLVALSNMPEKSISHLGASKPGLKVITFEKTPVMSTYVSHPIQRVKNENSNLPRCSFSPGQLEISNTLRQ